MKPVLSSPASVRSLLASPPTALDSEVNTAAKILCCSAGSPLTRGEALSASLIFLNAKTKQNEQNWNSSLLTSLMRKWRWTYSNPLQYSRKAMYCCNSVISLASSLISSPRSFISISILSYIRRQFLAFSPPANLQAKMIYTGTQAPISRNNWSQFHSVLRENFSH